MVINNNVQAIAGAYAVNQNRGARTGSAQGAAQFKDQVAISKEGQSFSSMLKELRGDDEIRQDKVDFYAEAIRNGSYSVSGRDIAEKIIAWN